MGSGSALHLFLYERLPFATVFLAIMCMHSMPSRRMRAQRKFLNPNMGRVRRLIARWSCSTRLLRYLNWRILMGISRSALMASSAARLAPLLSIVTTMDAARSSVEPLPCRRKPRRCSSSPGHGSAQSCERNSLRRAQVLLEGFNPSPRLTLHCTAQRPPSADAM